MKLEQISLPKWPAMVVIGNKVTEEQAAEILIRTNSFWHTCNDHSWNKKVLGYLGVEADWGIKPDSYDKMQEVEKELGVIDLNYLENTRIMSSWIFGCKGWMNWNGVVGCNNYNIGKWPSVTSILEEWKLIAEAFPYLNLRCQLMDREVHDEGLSTSLVEYKIKNGEVKAVKPKSVLGTDGTPFNDLLCIIGNRNREIGCTFLQYKNAIDLVRKNRSK